MMSCNEGLTPFSKSASPKWKSSSHSAVWRVLYLKMPHNAGENITNHNIGLHASHSHMLANITPIYWDPRWKNTMPVPFSRILEISTTITLCAAEPLSYQRLSLIDSLVRERPGSGNKKAQSRCMPQSKLYHTNKFYNLLHNFVQLVVRSSPPIDKL